MTSFVFVQPHLDLGGAERQNVMTANHLLNRGHQVHFVLHEKRGALVHDLAPGVVVYDLALESHIQIHRIAHRLAHVLAELPPSFVIATLWSSVTSVRIAMDRIKVPHVVAYCENLDPIDHTKFIRFGRTKQLWVSRTFQRAELIVATSESVASAMKSVYKLSVEPLVITPGVDLSIIESCVEWREIEPHSKRIRIVTVGKLTQLKGLPDIWDALSHFQIPFEWHVVGDGPLYGWLRTLKPPKGSEVVLHGALLNPYGVIANSDVMVHGSRSEAFGGVVIESLALGVPVIAADAMGPREIQQRLGAEPGMLSLFPRQDVAALATRLAAAKDLIRPTRSDFLKYVAPYQIARSIDAWERLVFESSKAPTN